MDLTLFDFSRAVDEVAKCQSYPKDQIDSIVQKAELSYQEKLDQVVTSSVDDQNNNQDSKDSAESKIEPKPPASTAVVDSNSVSIGNNNYNHKTIESKATSTEHKESKMTSIVDIRRENIYNKKPSTSPVKYNRQANNLTDNYDDHMENIYLNKPNTSPVNSRLTQNREFTEDNVSNN